MYRQHCITNADVALGAGEAADDVHVDANDDVDDEDDEEEKKK